MTKREKKIKERLAIIPPVYRSHYKKAVSGKSLRAAITSFCLECVQWQRVEAKNCTGLGCPLYAVRPYQTDSKSGD